MGVTIIRNTNSSIKYISRTATPGEEMEMVNRYVNVICEKYNKVSTKNYAIFIEPQIESGYPDIVIIEYRNIKSDQWVKKRNQLTNNDLKILYEVQKIKHTTVPEISKLLGFSQREIIKSVEMLNACNLLYFKKNKESVRNKSLKSYCSVTKIIAIEAKINKWNDAINQARKNIWFATESYILMNRDNCAYDVFNTCRLEGIGIILVNGKIEKTLLSEKRDFPVSYMSLLFNEWIQRLIHLEVN